MTQEQLRMGIDSFQTGTICTDSNLYKCSDDVFTIIEYVAAGQPFPNGPFGNGKGKTVWRKITLATDGSRKTFSVANTAV
jgi:trans-2-enoyl-CoA reductase